MYRLRDLDRRGTSIAAAVAILLALPFAAAIVRAQGAGWLPSGDNGSIGLQAIDVLTGHAPLVGLPSTAGEYVEANPRHPGPIEFYALAVPMKVLGPGLGMVTWTALANGASVLVAAWVVFRRAGPVVGLWGAVVLACLAYAQGPAQLTDPVSSNAGGIPMVALAVLAVALAAGDRRLLPLFALWSAYVTQQHLGVFAFGVALTAGGLVGLVAPVAWERVRRRPQGPRALETGSVGERWWPWVGAAFVAVLCWLPVLIDLATRNPSNIEKMTHFSGSEGRQTVGAGAGLRQAARALGVPPLIARTDLSGYDLIAPLSILTWLAAGAVLVCLGAVVVRRWRSHPAMARAALAALCLAASGAVIGSNVPRFESDRLNLYRWSFVVSALTWLVLGWAAGSWLAATRHRRAAGPRWETPWIAVAAVAAITVAACTVAGPSSFRDGELFRTEARLNQAVLEAVEGQHTVLLLPYGTMSSRSLAGAVAVHLESNGHRVILPYDELPNYGNHRSVAQAPNPDAAIVIRTGAGTLAPREPGAEILFSEDFNEGRDTVAQLVAQIGDQPVVVSPEGPALARAVGADPATMELALGKLAVAPHTVFYNDPLVRLLARGYLSSPRFDPALLDDLLRNPLEVAWSEDRIEAVEIAPAQALRLYPNIGAPTEASEEPAAG